MVNTTSTTTNFGWEYPDQGYDASSPGWDELLNTAFSDIDTDLNAHLPRDGSRGMTGNLSIATGQAIEDGSGNERLLVGANGVTSVFPASGSPYININDAANMNLVAGSGESIDIYDGNFGGTAVTYLPSSTAPGTLELTNADLDAGGNDITNANSVSTDKVHTKSPAANIEAFGAVPNDSSSASTNVSAIQDALDNYPVVLVPPKTYYVDGTVYLPSQTEIIGFNSQRNTGRSRFVPTSGLASSTRFIQSKDYASDNKIKQSRIKGIYFDLADTLNVAVELIAQEVTIEDCVFKYGWSYGIHLEQKSASNTLNNTITNNSFHPNPGGARWYDGVFIDYGVADTDITDNYIEGCDNAGVRDHGYNTEFEQNHIFDVAIGYKSQESKEKRVTNNYIEMVEEEAVWFNSGDSQNSELDGIVSENIFRNINTTGNANGVVDASGSDLSELIVKSNILRRDSGRTDTVDHIFYSDNSMVPGLIVEDNKYRSDLVNNGETNINGDTKRINSDVTLGDALTLEPISPPSSPSSGYTLYVDTNDGSLKAKDSAGNVSTIVS